MPIACIKLLKHINKQRMGQLKTAISTYCFALLLISNLTASGIVFLFAAKRLIIWSQKTITIKLKRKQKDSPIITIAFAPSFMRWYFLAPKFCPTNVAIAVARAKNAVKTKSSIFIAIVNPAIAVSPKLSIAFCIKITPIPVIANWNPIGDPIFSSAKK